jgi:hypothetical protein
MARASEVKTAVGSGIEIEWVSADANDGDNGIVAVEIETIRLKSIQGSRSLPRLSKRSRWSINSLINHFWLS